MLNFITLFLPNKKSKVNFFTFIKKIGLVVTGETVEYLQRRLRLKEVGKTALYYRI